MATREQLQEYVCSHGCVIDKKRGMGTNGPCAHARHPHHLSDEDRRIWCGLLEATRVHRRRAEELEAELHNVRANHRKAVYRVGDLNAENARLREACQMARDAIAKLMGDTDLDNDDSRPFRAIQILTDVIVRGKGPTS